jgi:hypothetical protein
MLNPSVKGGVVDRAARSDSPKTKHGREVQQQGNVLVLNPHDEALRKRTIVHVDMDRNEGRREAGGDKQEQVILSLAGQDVTETPGLDILRGMEALRAQVPGGDSVLKDSVALRDNPVLEKKRAGEEKLEQAMRALDIRAVKEEKEQARRERKEAMNKVSGQDKVERQMKRAEKNAREVEERAALERRRRIKSVRAPVKLLV